MYTSSFSLYLESSSEQSASWAAFDIDPMSYYAGEDQAQAPLLGSNSSGSVRVQASVLVMASE